MPIGMLGIYRLLFLSVCPCALENRKPPLPSARQHPSYGDCLKARREYYQNSSVLDCVTMFTVCSTLM